MKSIPVILGSQSPRRRKILSTILGGTPFTVCVADTKEIHDSMDPVRTVTINAAEKYRAVRKMPECPANAALIAADTLVWLDNMLIGKPRDLTDAAAVLSKLSGRTHIVYTGVALGLGEDPELRVEAASVTFKTLSIDDIASYLTTVNPLDRAGAYDIDESGDRLIAGYCGLRTTIMGLPDAPVRDWLKSLI